MPRLASPPLPMLRLPVAHDVSSCCASDISVVPPKRSTISVSVFSEHAEQAIGAAATHDVFDPTVEIRAGGLADATANNNDILNQPELSKHSFKLSSDLRQLFLVALEQRDGWVSRLVFGHGSTPIRS
jgi:hypothetical protein